jgi:2-polyprenyl-3-methyl-5-hydroxy-6-metoxy-1,4-benzoquinol methylase
VQADWPELSDLLLDTDPVTLARRPVSRAAVRERLRQHGMRAAERILDDIPGGEWIDPAAVDGILVRSHCELQRLSYEFRNGRRLRELLVPLLTTLRARITERPIRIVDLGCGLGFVIRWLAAHGQLGADVELLGCDFNPTLVGHAQRLTIEEGLSCSFQVANAFTLARAAHVLISTGVIHHFRGDDLSAFFQSQVGSGAAAMLHCDIKASWAAPIGSWMFHRARMREPLARHDGVLSAIRAHRPAALAAAAATAGATMHFGLFDGHPSLMPIVRTLNTVVGIRAPWWSELRSALGRDASRLLEFA